MKNLFSNNTKIVFLTQNTMPYTQGLYDVILAPQFYWVKKVSLPVKSLGDAKKLSESVYEGSLPKGTYSYEVSKAGDEFIIIAFDKEEISSLLKRYFTKDAKVNAIYFSQYEFSDLDACCTIDAYSSLVNIDGLLMQVPRNCTEPKLTIDDLLKNVKLSKTKVKLGSLDHEVMDRRTFVYLAAGVVAILSAFILEYIDYKKEASALGEAKTALIRKYDLPRTSMQLKSIKNSLNKTFKKQKALREQLYAFSKLPLTKDEYIESISFDDKGAQVRIKVNSQQREEMIKQKLTPIFKIKNSTFDDNILTLEIAS